MTVTLTPGDVATTTGTTSDGTGKKKGRTVTLTTNDMQKRKNDVKARTTLPLSLLDEHQLRFTKGSETLEKMFNRLQVIVSQLQFMDVEIKQDDLNQKFLTSLAPEWLMHTIVWRNKSDLDTMSLDDLYNHLKVYESEVKKKSKPNAHNMAFISSAKHSSGNEEVNNASGSTASINVSTASANIRIDKDDMEEMDIKWNIALLSMRADRFWKKTGKKISIQGTDVVGFDKSKAPKALMTIDGVGWDWSYMANDKESHALIADEETPTKFSLIAKTSAESEVFDNSLCSKAWLAQVEARLVEHRNQELKYCKKIRVLEFETESRANCIESLTKDLELLKKEKEFVLDRTPSFADDILTDYSRPSPTIESTSDDSQNRNPSVTETEASPSTILPKPFIKFVKATDRSTETKTAKVETAKPAVKYTVMYSKASKSSKVRGNQRNWNNLKSHQLGANFVMKKRTCYNCAIHRPYRPPIRPVRPNMNVAQPKRTSFHKPTHLYNKRPFQRTSAVRSQFRDPRVATANKKFPTVNRKLPTVNRKFPTGNTKFSTADMGNKGKAVKASTCWFWKPSENLSNKGPNSNSVSVMFKKYTYIDTQGRLKGCKITRKGTIKTGKLEFENVYFVKDLKYNLFSVSQICDNKNSVLFIDLEYIVLGRDFKLLDDSNVLLRTLRQHNMYSINLNNIVSHKDLTCLVAKAFADEGMLWHRRLGYLNFKTLNRLVRHNLVRGLPSKCFEKEHTRSACLKGKQHKASCKSKLVNSVTKPLHTLHIDLFGPTSVSSISYKWYCLVVTDDFSRFTWTFFLKTKDETSGILRKFLTEIENLKDLKVKIIRCDNGGEFRNKEMDDFCSQKGIKRKFSNARTPQQNGVAERRNKTLIEAARTMVLLNKSHNKNPYELFNGKFEAKGDEGYFIGYSMSSKAFKVFNKRTKRVKENLHIEFLENKAIEKGAGLNWLFDIDSLTKSINYVSVVSGTNSTNLSGTKDAASQEVKKDVSSLRYIALPNWVHDALLESSSCKPQDDCSTDVPESSGNSNPTATLTNPSAD
nr:hypothetical protein [Tanacetum cinerariifolium]